MRKTKTKRKSEREKGMRKTKIGKREREVEKKNLPSNGERKCLPMEMQAETKKRESGREKKRELGGVGY